MAGETGAHLTPKTLALPVLLVLMALSVFMALKWSDC
jgi:hypothetical protein